MFGAFNQPARLVLGAAFKKGAGLTGWGFIMLHFVGGLSMLLGVPFPVGNQLYPGRADIAVHFPVINKIGHVKSDIWRMRSHFGYGHHYLYTLFVGVAKLGSGVVSLIIK